MYASLKDSYQWNLMNNDNAITNRISEIMSTGVRVTPEMVNTALVTIRNRIRCPIIQPITECLNSGKIVMAYCSQVKIPLYLPFVVLQQGKGNYFGVVFLNHCDCEPGEIEYTVDARKLKVALESCYFALRIMELDQSHNPKLTAPSLIRPSVKIYTHMVTECINRKFSIKLDQTVYNQISFMVSRYFLTTVLGYNPDSATMENFCLYELKNPDIGSIRAVNDQFSAEDFKDISTFITKLTSIPELKGRIGKLNVNAFIQSMVTLYNAVVTLAIENYAYLVYNILSVVNTTYVNNYHMLKNIIGDDGAKLYGYLVTILGE